MKGCCKGRSSDERYSINSQNDERASTASVAGEPGTLRLGYVAGFGRFFDGFACQLVVVGADIARAQADNLPGLFECGSLLPL
jgi:hypothetical protein